MSEKLLIIITNALAFLFQLLFPYYIPPHTIFLQLGGNLGNHIGQVCREDFLKLNSLILFQELH